MDLTLRLLAHVCRWRLLEQNGYLPVFWEPWVLKSPHYREGWALSEQERFKRFTISKDSDLLEEFWSLWQGGGCSAF